MCQNEMEQKQNYENTLDFISTNHTKKEVYGVHAIKRACKMNDLGTSQ